VPDPFVYTTARNVVVGSLLLLGVLMTGRGHELGRLCRASWAKLALIGVVGGSVPFLLFFWGLSLTAAPLAALIQKSLFVWVALLAVPVLGEGLGAWQLFGLGALAVGLLIQGPTPAVRPGPGPGLILVATLLWAVETILVRHTLRDVSPTLAATARMAGGAIVMLGFVVASGRLPTLLGLHDARIIWVVLPGLLLLAYVVTWYAALRRAPAVVVTSLLTLGAPITTLLSVLTTPSGAGTGASGLVGAPMGGQLVGSSVLALACAVIMLATWRSSRAPAIFSNAASGASLSTGTWGRAPGARRR
jgi:drug/metabolite transporter (DMT)-like permease